MKQFFTYVAATVVGLIIATVISAIASMFMLVVMLVMSESAATPNIGQHSILKLDLSGTLSERHQGMTLVQQMQGNKDQSKGLDDIVASIRYASNDDRIEGIYIDCNGMSGGIASLQYIRQTLADFKKSGKWIAAYGDAYTQGNYYIASLADSIWLNPMGAVEVTGMGGRFMFFKGLLDKLGIEMQVLKVGTYKSAVEPYVLTAPSEANIKQTREYITPIWQNVAGDIAEARGVELEVVNSWADSVLMTQNPHTFPKRNIVTGLLYRHEAESMLKEMSGIDNDDNLRFVTPVEYMKTVKPHRYGNKIALLYAEGEIVDNGENGIVGADMAPMIMDLAENDDIDALVLRVNSPGGSAFASEQIWEALQQFKALTGKPFYVSMGDVAASGGYYISCGADRIYAEPLTLTGSIGIFGLIPNAQKLLNDKLGVHTATVATNTGTFPELFKPMPAPQREAMQGYVNRGYKLFAERCAAGRHLPVDSIYAIAQGRVWDGASAHEIGLVDKMGGLQLAISDMAAELDAADDYRVVPYPDNSDNIWAQVRSLRKNIETRIVSKQLGAAADYYFKLRAVAEMSPLQCRMEIMMME